MEGSGVQVEGICSYPAQSEGYDGTHFTRGEMESKIKEMVGKPILEEHTGKEIGKVKGGEIEGDQIKAYVEVGRDNIEGIRAISKLRDGKLKGLSLGMKFVVENPDTNPRIVEKRINEISLTSDPDCPSALIKTVGPDSALWVATTKFWKRKVENENLKIEAYKASEFLREKRRREINRARMGGPSSGNEAPATDTPAKETQATQESRETKESEATKKVEEETLSLEQKNKFMADYIAEMHRVAGGKDNMDTFVKQGKDLLAKENEEWVKEKKNMGEYITTLFEKFGKNPESCKRIISQLNKEETTSGHPLVEFITAAKAQLADSQSQWESRYQNRKKELENEATLRDKFIGRIGTGERQDVIERPEPPTKKQKMSYEESFGNRFSPTRIPPEWRGQVFEPQLGGAHKLFMGDRVFE